MKKLLSFICFVVGICIISITGSGCKNAKSSNLGLDTITIDAASYVSEEVIAKEKLEDILKELVGIPDGNVILSKVNKFCTEEFKTGFKQACDQADKEGCERPRLWWSYSDDDPEKYEIKEIVMTSDNAAKAEVKLLSEMYIGRFNVVVKKEGDTWLIDKIDEVETLDNPNFDISDNTDGSSSTIETSDNLQSNMRICRKCGKKYDPQKETISSNDYCYDDYPQTCKTCGKTYTINSSGSGACLGTCGPCYQRHLSGKVIEWATQ